MSTVKVDTLVASDGTSPVTLTKQSAATTRLTFDQPADTNVDSLNISSAEDSATGLVTSTFINAYGSATARQVMVSGWNTNNGGSSSVAVNGRGINAYQQTTNNATNKVRTQTTYGANASSHGLEADLDGHYVAIFGDLA